MVSSNSFLLSPVPTQLTQESLLVSYISKTNKIICRNDTKDFALKSPSTKCFVGHVFVCLVFLSASGIFEVFFIENGKCDVYLDINLFKQNDNKKQLELSVVSSKIFTLRKRTINNISSDNLELLRCT